VGYVARQVPLAGRPSVDVQLTESPRSLEQVVVIGYGSKRRASLTESVGTVSADAIQQVPIASVDQALQGRVAGAQVTTTSGVPGSPVAVRIRGVSTVGNTQPLFVVDGVPVGRGEDPRTNPLTTINPNDIESLSVLKDASSAAVYGVQASNGVILITTKRGRQGGPPCATTATWASSTRRRSGG
jgi:TonB-dependent SusC/RagA subfamily outer membrane receptor